MRALLLVLAVVMACDAGAKPEPAKQASRGSATASTVTDCKAVVTALEAAADRNWIKEPPRPRPSAASIRALEAACANWPESFKACVVTSTNADLGPCVKDRPEVTDELLLLGLELALDVRPLVGWRWARVDLDGLPLPHATPCARVIAKLPDVMFAYDPKLFPLASALTPKLLESCAEDGWSEKLKACIVASTASALAHGQACEQLVPPALADKVAARLWPMLPPGVEPPQ